MFLNNQATPVSIKTKHIFTLCQVNSFACCWLLKHFNYFLENPTRPNYFIISLRCR